MYINADLASSDSEMVTERFDDDLILKNPSQTTSNQNKFINNNLNDFLASEKELQCACALEEIQEEVG